MKINFTFVKGDVGRLSLLFTREYWFSTCFAEVTLESADGDDFITKETPKGIRPCYEGNIRVIQVIPAGKYKIILVVSEENELGGVRPREYFHQFLSC